jgi:1-acyl-sn-glycerol-3-phosphate acyltransferase
VVKVVFRHRAAGVENVPRVGGFVLAANHWSNFDPWPLAIPFFPRRFFRFMAKAELFRFPLGSIVRAGGAFEVRRGEQDEQAIATAVALAREGQAIVMFPEGTRRRKGLRKKHEARWRTGAARIALEASVPLVPAGIAGTERLARLGPLRVAYGAPIQVDDLADLPGGEAARIATDRLAEAVTALEQRVA